MSDDEQDFVIEATDAGASSVIPMEAGQIKKGGYVILCWTIVVFERPYVRCGRLCPMDARLPMGGSA
jgi:hypothetical protein